MKKAFKIIGGILIAAAVVCFGVGIYEFVKEQNAGKEYQELTEEIKSEEDDSQKAEVDIPIDFKALKEKNRMCMHRSAFLELRLIIRYFKEKTITHIIWIIRSIMKKKLKERSLQKIIIIRILKIQIRSFTDMICEMALCSKDCSTIGIKHFLSKTKKC